ncbi:hypothetical protein RFM23_09440 [Mesorhizobium abyssinicae]|uniref:Uncharacterized protein n=1 Tax=Mesorhizobium abyssinicae TaxID=1209958 RepID=A0ABU5AKS1_9HYPH|nr:hypothetical protein [Mesorhizobium abyssinicae]MDX8537844.1 hypothetical protein [Mesorhizobium abyssinicae]
MANMSDEERVEKAIKKLEKALAELQAMKIHSLWTNQRTRLRAAALAIEDLERGVPSLWDEGTNR